MKRLKRTVGLLALAVLAIGCGGDESATTTQETPAVATDTSVTMSTTDTSATGYTATDTTGTTTPSDSETISSTNNP